MAALFRRQLAETDAELAQGRLTPDQAAAARTEITRRMLGAAEHGDAGSARASDRPADALWRIGTAIGIGAVLPVAAIAVYFAVGTPAAIDRNAAAKADVPHGAAELAAAADRSRRICSKSPAISKAGPCSPAPWPR